MKSVSIPLVLIAMASAALANVAPTVVIQSAAMRPGTTLMDVVYRVNDPDDATVKTRSLAFVDGVRSFAKVLRPVTFVEGTAANLGDAIPANTNHTLTWDVGTDWDIDLGQVKFEVLARDGRGLLPIDWISIPAAGGQPALTISKDTPSNAAVLNALFWQYAAGDPALTLSNGVLSGSPASGVFAGVPLVNGTTLQFYSAPYLFKQMNLDPASSEEQAFANTIARAGLLSTTSWHAVNRTYGGLSIIFGKGNNSGGKLNIPVGLTNIIEISINYSHTLALKSDGIVVAWGDNSNGQTRVPPGLTGVTSISAGDRHSLALKSDGTVVAWGAEDDDYNKGQAAVPAGLAGVVAIAAGDYHSLALRNDGTVVSWGSDVDDVIDTPEGLTDVVAIDAGYRHSLALKSDGTVVSWGSNDDQIAVPAGLTGVVAISAGGENSWALKNDGTLVNWPLRNSIQSYYDTPAGVTGITDISAGTYHIMVRAAGDRVVAWPANDDGETDIPTGLAGVAKLSAGDKVSLMLKPKAQ